MNQLKELIKDCKKGDRKAQERLYHKYKEVLMFLSLKYCRNREQAQDNLHDSFITIFQNIKKYKGTGSFEGWMKRIVINKAIAMYKKESFLNVVINEEITKEVIIEENELNAIPLSSLMNIIQELPDRYRLVFSLYELDDYSHKEISKMLQISEGTSKSNLHRAKALLKKTIINTNNLSSKKLNGNS